MHDNCLKLDGVGFVAALVYASFFEWNFSRDAPLRKTLVAALARVVVARLNSDGLSAASEPFTIGTKG